MKIPTSLNWLKKYPKGSDWISSLPLLVDELTSKWNLTISGSPYSGGNVSYVVPVTRGIENYMLKIQWPDRESEMEAQALKAWNGNGAIQLIAEDKNRYALLLEKCEPGNYLADTEQHNPISVLVDLLPRLWIETSDVFQTLYDEAKHWYQSIPEQWEETGRSCERKLIDEALECIDKLANTQGPQVLLHQDLHGHNILSSARQAWLAIDPKPLVGEREFSLSPIIRSFEFGADKNSTIARLDYISETLNLNRDRARCWTIAQTMAWGFGGSYDQNHHQTVRWMIDAK